MNIGHSTNYNVLNAMRLVQNGFGAIGSYCTRALGNPYLRKWLIKSSGGIGPSSFGAPAAWSLTGVYGVPNVK
jgi:hypothetical protein